MNYQIGFKDGRYLRGGPQKYGDAHTEDCDEEKAGQCLPQSDTHVNKQGVVLCSGIMVFITLLGLLNTKESIHVRRVLISHSATKMTKIAARASCTSCRERSGFSGIVSAP